MAILIISRINNNAARYNKIEIKYTIFGTIRYKKIKFGLYHHHYLIDIYHIPSSIFINIHHIYYHILHLQ